MMWWIGIILITGIAGCGIFLFFASYNIGSGIYVKTLCRKETQERVVSLTFDDGPDALYTPQILDILKQYQAPGTFFCIGHKAEKHPDLICRMLEEGHLIGNHSYSHTAFFPLFPEKKMTADLKHAQQILEGITKRKISCFRPPFGVTNPTVSKVVNKLGYITIGWSIRSLDTTKRPVDKIYRRVVKRISPGSVILLHDCLPAGKELLCRLLEYLKDNNYKIIRVDALFELK